MKTRMCKLCRFIAKNAVLAFFAFVLFTTDQANAARFQTETSSSAQALAMGNAGINSVQGAYALFYNPANIAMKSTHPSFQIMNFQLEGNGGEVASIGGGKIKNPMKLSDIYRMGIDQGGSSLRGRYSFYPNITVRSFSLGLLYERDEGAWYSKKDDTLGIRARDRFAPTAALSFRLFGGILRFGGSVQYLSIGDADTAIKDASTKSGYDFKDYVASGASLVKTAGFTLTFPFKYLPSFSAVLRDIGGSSFSRKPMIKFGSSTGTPYHPMSTDLAVSNTLYLGSKLEIKFEGDYRDFTNRYKDDSRLRHVNLGTEIKFYDLFRFRGGYMNGYPTAGLGLHVRKGDINFAWYSEELGDRLRTSRDQHYVLQFSSHFLGSGGR